MRESVKLQHFNEYQKLNIYNLIVEIDGLQDLEQININKVILSDSKDIANEISFLNYIQPKIDIAKIVLRHKEYENRTAQPKKTPFSQIISIDSNNA